MDIEEGEAEWLLDVLEAVFDLTFVQPIMLEERKEKLNKLNAKLRELGKEKMFEMPPGVISILPRGTVGTILGKPGAAIADRPGCRWDPEARARREVGEQGTRPVTDKGYQYQQR
ncbi:hypothetical protein [Paenibacillus sp. GCM10012303]|uniref:hypothetical protein n=1 Tax=Paenibacillus sp. GCM10012303 TaxID=3317340 RepID=UPI00361D27E5